MHGRGYCGTRRPRSGGGGSAGSGVVPSERAIAVVDDGVELWGLALLEQQNEKDIIELLKIYQLCFDANLEDQSNIKFKKSYFLVAKCFEHCASTLYLLRNINIQEIPLNYSDTCTANITARAALESLLTFAFVFYLPQNDDDFELRLAYWDIAGLISRQDYTTVIPEYQQQLIREKIEIDDLKIKIQQNPHFKNLSKDHAGKILSGNWPLIGWKKTGIEIGMNEKIINQIYSYLSSYAHSDGLSNIQLKQLLADEKTNMPSMAELALPMILATMIDLLTKTFQRSKARLELLPSRDLVHAWAKVTKGGFKYPKQI
jgi:hypothetical protein